MINFSVKIWSRPYTFERCLLNFALEFWGVQILCLDGLTILGVYIRLGLFEQSFSTIYEL
jgi:hypothetical protein